TIQQIDEGPGNNTNSIQRNNDGTYFIAVPTPRQLNDGSGVVLNGVSVSVPQTQYNEGDSFTITFTTEQPVTGDLDLVVSLDFGTFDSNDFTGTLALTIPSGQNSISTSINLIDDSDDEGDEQLKISMGTLPSGYLPLNNNLIVRVVDNDYTVAPFGTPLNPTFGVVSSTQPNGYYDSLDGLSDTSLKQALQDIIANPSIVRAQTYNDVTDILKQADQNPANSNQVWLVYLEQGRAKLDFQTTASNVGTWNREHVFPRSRGGYDSIEADETADGIDIFWTTNADSLRHGNSDAHHIRAVDGPENSARGNLFYGQYTGPSGTAGMFRGDVARSIFYMAVRYNGLEVVNGYPEGNVGQFGDLATLLLWHQNDPPDDFEMNRNNVVYNWQFNRNPFIDEPELVDYLWGDMVGQVWDANLSIDDNLLSQIRIFPNPASSYIHVRGVDAETKIELYTMEGKLIDEKHFNSDTRLELHLSSGMYLVKLFRQDQVSVSKLIIK
ncbi:MAG TPA: endonuclease, partial [Flavobacteriaceae bacterium]|nr:endonuclease [Flavobacteriaceae bacterium]